MGQPLPSERTLQERMENVKFCPGIPRELFPSIRAKINGMNDFEREAVLLIDEISITPGLDYDPSIGLIMGKPTMPSADGNMEDLATHALVFMLGGVSTRWKQTVAYQLTGNSFCPKQMKNLTFNLITECEKLGVKISTIVSDMGGQNQAFLRECGVIIGRYSVTVNYCKHPCNSERKLFFMLDPPHILKNIRNHLTEGHEILLPNYIVEKYKLPSNIVSIDPVKQLLEINEKMDLKLTPQLRESVMKPSHYDKMKVGLALSLLNHDVAAAMEYCIEKNILDNTALATAWFIKTVFQWFKLLSSRSTNMALSHIVETKYEESVNLLKEVKCLFQEIKIGPRAVWKPVQTAVILSTTTVLDLQKLFLEEKGYKYLLLSRFSQDALENLFSMIRMKNAIPTVKSLKYALRLITVSQFFQPNRHGSYDTADAEFLAEFLKFREVEQNNPEGSELQEQCQCIAENITIEPSEQLGHFLPQQESEENVPFHENEKEVLYHLCGRTVREVRRRYKLCPECEPVLFLDGGDELPTGLNRLTELKAYVKPKSGSGPLVHANIKVFAFLQSAEELFRKNEKKLLTSSMCYDELMSCTKPLLNMYKFPECHSIGQKVLRVYFTSRLYFLVRKANNAKKIAAQSKCGSKSIGMQNAVKNLR